MLNPNMLLHEQVKIVMGAAPAAASTSDYVSLKNCAKMTALILAKNPAGGITASDLTINQATNVAAGSAKVLTAGTAATGYRNIDTGAADLLAAFAITSGTFATDTTVSKDLLYVLEINAADLDVANGFDCIQIANANGVAVILGIVYLLWPVRYGAAAANMPSAIVD